MKSPESGTDCYLIIATGEKIFALPAHCIQKVIHPLPVTPLPFVSTCIDGLINVEGNIAVQVSLACLNNTTPAARKELVLIETGRALCALEVDRVLERSVLSTDTEQENIVQPTNHSLVCATAQYKNQTVYLLDPARIGELIQTSPLPDAQHGILGRLDESDIIDDDTSIACLTVSVGDDLYAFELSSVVEIIEPIHWVPLPAAPNGVLGLGLLHNQVLPVLDLAQLMTSHSAASTEKNWLIVVERDEQHYGLQVPALQGVKHFPFDSYQPVVDSEQAASGLFITDNTTTVLLSPRQIISSSIADSLTPYLTQASRQQQNTNSEDETVDSFLTVILCQKTYAIPVQHIRRVLPFAPMEPIGHPNDMVCGAINVEEKIIPVLSLEHLLHLDNHTEKKEYVILSDGAQEWAICVTAAKNIVQVPTSHIKKISAADSQLLSGMANIDEELVPLLNPALFGQQAMG